MTAWDFAWWALLWGAGAVLFLRRPLVVVGLVASGVLWTSVGPWAGWLGLGLAVLGAIGRSRGAGGGDGWGLLGRGPLVSAAALSAAVAVLAPGWWVLAGLAGLVGTWAWWVHGAGYRLLVRRPVGSGRARRLAGGRRSGSSAPVGRQLGVVRCGCGGLMVIDAHVAADPSGSLARATCGACGARFWGAVDPANPNGGPLWFEVPASGGGQRRGDGR